MRGSDSDFEGLRSRLDALRWRTARLFIALALVGAAIGFLVAWDNSEAGIEARRQVEVPVCCLVIPAIVANDPAAPAVESSGYKLRNGDEYDAFGSELEAYASTMRMGYALAALLTIAWFVFLYRSAQARFQEQWKKPALFASAVLILGLTIHAKPNVPDAIEEGGDEFYLANAMHDTSFIEEEVAQSLSPDAVAFIRAQSFSYARKDDLLLSEIGKISAPWPGMTDFEYAVLRDLVEHSGNPNIRAAELAADAPEYLYVAPVKSYTGIAINFGSVLIGLLLILLILVVGLRWRQRKFESRIEALVG